MAGYSDLDRLPEYQNVATNVRDLWEANVMLKIRESPESAGRRG